MGGSSMIRRILSFCGHVGGEGRFTYLSLIVAVPPILPTQLRGHGVALKRSTSILYSKYVLAWRNTGRETQIIMKAWRYDTMWRGE